MDGRAGFGLGNCAAIVLAVWSHSRASDQVALGECGLSVPLFKPVDPIGRFRDTHLAHHHGACLTDPYDDPEANYLDPAKWEKMPRIGRWMFLANRTLAGRLLLCAFIS